MKTVYSILSTLFFAALILFYLCIQSAFADTFHSGEVADLADAPFCKDKASAILLASTHQKQGFESAKVVFVQLYKEGKCFKASKAFHILILREVYAGHPAVLFVNAGLRRYPMYLVSDIQLEDKGT